MRDVLDFLKDFPLVVECSFAESSLPGSIDALLEHELHAREFMLHDASCAIDSISQIGDVLVLVEPVCKPLQCDDLLHCLLQQLKAHEVDSHVSSILQSELGSGQSTPLVDKFSILAICSVQVHFKEREGGDQIVLLIEEAELIIVCYHGEREVAISRIHEEDFRNKSVLCANSLLILRNAFI